MSDAGTPSAVRPAGSTEIDEDERPVIEALREIGVDTYGVHRLRDLADRHPGMREILLEHLQRDYPDNVRAALAAALGGPTMGDLFPVVVERYRAERSWQVKDQLADAISRSGPTHLDDVIELLRDASLGRSRVQLVSALTRSRQPRAKEALEDLRDDPDLRVELARRSKP